MTATFLLFVGVIGALKILYTLKTVPWIAQSLFALTAAILVYPAALHVLFARLPVKFFEGSVQEIGRSLRIFLLTALAIFPIFIVAAHVYQTTLLGVHLRLHRFPWQWSTIPFQIFAIALPEEFFFRGYLQTRLKQKFSGTFSLFGSSMLTVPIAVPLTSLIFAASHSFIAFQWWHFAIFFPSLAFGWLREKTQGLVAPILFHATCNTLMVVLSRAYR